MATKASQTATTASTAKKPTTPTAVIYDLALKLADAVGRAKFAEGRLMEIRSPTVVSVHASHQPSTTEPAMTAQTAPRYVTIQNITIGILVVILLLTGIWIGSHFASSTPVVQTSVSTLTADDVTEAVNKAVTPLKDNFNDRFTALDKKFEGLDARVKLLEAPRQVPLTKPQSPQAETPAEEQLVVAMDYSRRDWFIQNCLYAPLNEKNKDLEAARLNSLSPEKWKRQQDACIEATERTKKWQAAQEAKMPRQAQAQAEQPQPEQTSYRGEVRQPIYRDGPRGYSDGPQGYRDDQDGGSKQYCPPLGSREFLAKNPKPHGRICEMFRDIPGKPCGGWRCLRR